MDQRTYEELPRDVLIDLGPDRVRIDPAIPPGQVDVHSQGGVTRMPVNAFVRARRRARKAERRARKVGRR